MTNGILSCGRVDDAPPKAMAPKETQKKSVKTRILFRLGQITVWCIPLAPLYQISRYFIIPEITNRIQARNIKPVHANRREAEQACDAALETFLANESDLFENDRFTKRTVLATYCKPR